MKIGSNNQSTEVYTSTIGRGNFYQDFKTYFLNPLSAGLVGFAVFFSLILLTKLFSYFLGINDTFGLNLNDVIYSLTGFVFAAGAKFLEFFGKE